MKTLCIIPCSSKKVWDKNPDAGPTRAGDVYTGTFHKKCREYAERFYRNWVIPSAKYGYLFPDDIVPESYNVTFNRKSSGPITVEQLKEQVRVKGLDRFDRVVVVAGKNYARIIKKSFVDVTEFV